MSERRFAERLIARASPSGVTDSAPAPREIGAGLWSIDRRIGVPGCDAPFPDATLWRRHAPDPAARAPGCMRGETLMTEKIEIEPIGWVRAKRDVAEDDFWGGAESRIELASGFEPEALAGLEDFSHAEIVFVFDRVTPEQIVRGARHPRGNAAWPRVGIFAQRAKNRPNRLGSTICRILRREGRTLVVAELDAIDGTPVVDVKPVMREFLPREDVRQPAWSTELMREYWAREK